MNENGYSSLYLLNPQTFKYKKVKSIPIGLIGGMEFNRNNKSLGLTINTFQSPSDAHVLDLKSNPLGYGSLTRWTFSEVGGLDTSKFVEPKLFIILHLMAERFLHLYTPIRLKNLNR